MSESKISKKIKNLKFKFRKKIENVKNPELNKKFHNCIFFNEFLKTEDPLFLHESHGLNSSQNHSSIADIAHAETKNRRSLD
jgi:hypothetical protein